MQWIGRARLKFGKEVEIKISRLFAFCVNEESTASNFFPDDEKASDDIGEQCCAKTLALVPFVNAEPRQ